ncbi:endonuclease domain-containing protein [Haloactinomyces albus]|uniref:Very-short-patch-repair endonuclease n=1 Tax=Haloactinomyces albus TaxID=1352928 RepID=A0AAE3ZD58_9ACTN|nr:DUF559 domain-containing protein [Haloactinomyces albus]MDR7301087.1 very-short-patch-repair endonuclease [Haloactinomyces albus]
MTKLLYPPTVNDEGLFTRHAALAEGWTDADLRKNPDVYRVVHGVYALSEVPLTHRLKCRAVSMRLPEEAIITGRSAATLYGVELAAAHDRVEALVSERKYMNRRFGTRCWSVRAWDSEHGEWHGIRLATVERAAFDLLARNPLNAGVANVDALLHHGLTTAASLGKFLSGRHDHGIVKARRGFELLDGRAESLPESSLRLVLILGGLHPEPQVEIHDHLGFVARVDLGFRREKVAVEYDGAWHGEPEQFRRDQERLARLHANGWQVIVITADRLRSAPQEIVDQVRKALAVST